MLRSNLSHWVEQSYTYSYQHYGLPWGVTCLVGPAGGASIALYTAALTGIKDILFISHHGTLVQVVVVVIITLHGLPISLYFTCKTKPPAVPYIFLMPTSALFCCCSTKRAKSFVFWLALWMNSMFTLFFFFNGCGILLASLVQPVAVITNSLGLILVSFCAVNIMASAFVISAYICTKKILRPQGQGKKFFKAALLIPILFMAGSWCVASGYIAYITSNDARQGGAMGNLKSLSVPVMLVGLTIALKKLITLWLEHIPQNGSDPELVSLLKEV